jgi:hypothetical protein
MLPGEYPLTDLVPEVVPQYSFNRPLTFTGKKYETTLMARMNSASDYSIKGLFSSFTAIVGVDDATGEQSASATVEFVVSGDGRELWRSGPMKKSDPPKTSSVDVKGVKILSIKAEGPQTRGWGRGGVVAGWAEPILRR